MIDKETAIALAKEADAGFGRGAMPDSVVGIDAVVRLCNLAVAHEARDLALVQNLLKEYGLQALDVVEAFKAQNGAEPVAWAMHREDGLVFDVICPEEHQSYEGKYTLPLFTHPAHDDTALLRQAFDALENMTEGPRQRTITALRERLGEKA